MRTTHIRHLKAHYSQKVQALEPDDISARIVKPACFIWRESPRRRIARLLAHPALQVLSHLVEPRVEVPYRYDLMAVEERFTTEASLTVLLKLLGPFSGLRVLLPGCYLGGDDVQFWLRRGVRRLDGIDVYNLGQHWREVVPLLEKSYGAEVCFCQGSIEAIPYEDATFDVIVTRAVLEHVRNLAAMARETARVLRPGGYAWHAIGPFYTAFGGDHCIAAYGEDAGYDHLLLAEDEYQERIQNDAFFAKGEDPNLPFWARNNQFSFAPSEEYIKHFRKHFEVVHVLVKLSQPGFAYRTRNPQKWQRLRDAGYSESDLLVKSLNIVLHKR